MANKRSHQEGGTLPVKKRKENTAVMVSPESTPFLDRTFPASTHEAVVMPMAACQEGLNRDLSFPQLFDFGISGQSQESAFSMTSSNPRNDSGQLLGQTEQFGCRYQQFAAMSFAREDSKNGPEDTVLEHPAQPNKGPEQAVPPIDVAEKPVTASTSNRLMSAETSDPRSTVDTSATAASLAASAEAATTTWRVKEAVIEHKLACWRQLPPSGDFGREFQKFFMLDGRSENMQTDLAARKQWIAHQKVWYKLSVAGDNIPDRLQAYFRYHLMMNFGVDLAEE